MESVKPKVMVGKTIFEKEICDNQKCINHHKIKVEEFSEGYAMKILPTNFGGAENPIQTIGVMVTCSLCVRRKEAESIDFFMEIKKKSNIISPDKKIFIPRH